MGDREPAPALVGATDLVVVRYGDKASVLYGRCSHRGALMADGYVEGDNLICGVHKWDFRIDTGVSQSDSDDSLDKPLSADRESVSKNAVGERRNVA